MLNINLKIRKKYGIIRSLESGNFVGENILSRLSKKLYHCQLTNFLLISVQINNGIKGLNNQPISFWFRGALFVYVFNKLMR